ncbi:MAG: HAD-IIB family hydrolase [Bdellovibrionales bacterium]|nr:HAD-IIB family hydrolase [Bdellovibrionales bacterium]
MKSLKQLDGHKIKFVFTDIDDTLTNNGLLESVAFSAIWRLYRAGIHVIPVTGRPAGWCELIARQWPVKAVIGENGGFYFYYEQKKMQRCFVFDSTQRDSHRTKLDTIKNEILNRVHGADVASDQFCRLMDLAIDFCEDVKPLSAEQIQEIVDIFKAHGAQAKVSSIHVNGWFGEYDKLSMCKKFCQDVLKFDLAHAQNQVLFVGDSPNDEPMFSFFENSVGVANVNDFHLKFPPKYVTKKLRGEGFKELTDHILGPA